MRPHHLALAGLVSLASFAGGAAQAQPYPNRTISFTVGFAPGGFTDVLARTIAGKLQEKFGTAVIVENKAGAGGTVGAAQVAKSAPDGYALLLAHVASNAIAPGLYSTLPYDVIRDFTPIIRVASTPMLLTVNNEVPAKDVKSLIELAKTGKGLTFASSGNGSVQHLAAELFMTQTGTKMVHVPYRGSSQAMLDLLGGKVDLNFESPPNVLPQLSTGKVRVLAITSAARSPAIPNVPTMAEAGLKDGQISQWFAVMGPAGMPKEIVDKLNAEIGAILNTPEVIERIKSQDGTIIGGSAADFAVFLKEDTARWAKLIKDANVKIN